MGPSSPGAKLRRVLVLAAIAVAAAFPAIAEDRIEFSPLREVNVRLTSGAMVRGQLRSIAADQVVVVMKKDDAEKIIPITSVKIISTNDKSFTYSPAQESFKELIERPKLQGVTIHRSATPSASGDDASGDDTTTSASKRPNSPPDVFAELSGLGAEAKSSSITSSGGFFAQNGFAGASVRPGKKPKLDTTALASIADPTASALNPASVGTSGTAAGGGKSTGKPIGKPGETIICSNPLCRKEVPGARYGEQCPHCKIIWLEQSAVESIASAGSSNGASAASKGNPFGSGGNGQQGGGGAAAGAPVVSPTVVTSGGFSIESVPWWGKLVGFGGLIAVLWFVSQRR
jgi:hypothetical protein